MREISATTQPHRTRGPYLGGAAGSLRTIAICVVSLLFAGAPSAAYATLQTLPYPEPYLTKVLLLDSSGRLWVGPGSIGLNPNEMGGAVFDGGRWGRVHELDNANVTSAAEDSSRNVWIGTLQGLFRFDGETWSRYSAADGLADDMVEDLFVDRLGHIWAGTFGKNAVSVFDGISWKIVAGPTLNPGTQLRPMCQDSSGNVWFGDETQSAFRFDGLGWAQFKMPFASVYDSFYNLRTAPERIVLAGDGTLWFGTGASHPYLVHLVGDSLKVEGPQPAYNLVQSHDGTLWCTVGDYLQWGHLYRLDRSRWRPWSTSDSLPPHPGGCIADGVGGLWFSGGLSTIARFTPEGATIYQEPLGSWRLLDQSGAFEDSDGSLWFAGNPDGYARFDGLAWTRYTTADGLLPGLATTMIRDHTGAYWLGTMTGVTRYDGSTWAGNVPADSLGNHDVDRLAEDTRGNIWRVTGSTHEPVSYYDGSSWNDISSSLVRFPGAITSLLADRHGNVWFTGSAWDTLPGGIVRFDGLNWTEYFISYDGLGCGCAAAHEDRAGNVWFALLHEIVRYDGTQWTTYPLPFPYGGAKSFFEARDGTLWLATNSAGAYRFDGLTWILESSGRGFPFEGLWNLLEDSSGRIWGFPTSGGLRQFDGSSWREFGANQGLPPIGYPVGYASDLTGALWFNGTTGTIRYSPDLVPPITQFFSKPSPVMPTGALSALASIVYETDSGPEYSWRLDGGPWSPWTTIGSWSQTGIPDGRHVLEMRARDYARNVGPAARATFEVDATPPAPVLASPKFGDPVRGIVDVRGTAADPRFRSYRLEYRATGAATWDGASRLIDSMSPVIDGSLGRWDTSALPDGSYDLRLTVADSLGLAGTALATVIVDNHAPFFDETAPAKVSAAAGGNVYTTNAETHLYFPPHAFAQDALVMIAPDGAGAVPGSLADGGSKVLDGYEIEWAGALKKPARLTLSYAGAGLPVGTLALYRSADGVNWSRLGGTLDAANKSISLAVSLPGHYALFADNGLGAGTGSLSGIAFTPRVFSPTGTFADQEVGISFRLGKPAPVTVKVFSRSGRLIREVVAGRQLSAGENLIRWDGRDRNGGIVVDGMYLVTVEALGHTETRTLAVVK